jgi:hypothetical protein
MIGPVTISKAADQTGLQVPQSIRVQHHQITSRLASFAKRDGSIAEAAQKALVFIKNHYAKEEELVLPPLGLLPLIARGEISKDIEPAIAMADRTRAALPEFQNEHIQLTALVNDLIEAGKKSRDEELQRLATRIAVQSLNDIEVVQPTTILSANISTSDLRRPHNPPHAPWSSPLQRNAHLQFDLPWRRLDAKR